MAGVALFDVDGTLHEGYSIFPIYQAFADENFITNADNNRFQEILEMRNEGEISYNRFVNTTLFTGAEILKDKRVKIAQHITNIVLSDPEYEWFGYVEPTLQELKNYEVDAALITSAPEFIANGISKVLGIRFSINSVFGQSGGIKDPRYDGTAVMVINQRRKGVFAEFVMEHRQANRPGLSYAFGDSEGDIRMLESVDKPICIKPTDKLLAYAVLNNWQIIEDPDQPFRLLSNGLDLSLED
jgi:HAD superfamily phosphoserine phosphatase-like hydrolase